MLSIWTRLKLSSGEALSAYKTLIVGVIELFFYRQEDIAVYF